MIEFEQRFEQKLGEKAQKFLASTFKKIKKEKESKQVGYYTLPDNANELLEEIESFIKNHEALQTKSIKNLVVIGIGGSTLGTKAIHSVLDFKRASKIKLTFLENADPINVSTSLKEIVKEETLFLVISKSGTTIETTSIFKYILQKYDINLQSGDTKNLVSITDYDSPLWHFSQKYDIKSFAIPNNVGGRFSVLSAVGLVPLAILGYDIHALLKGAMEFEEEFFEQKQMHLLEKAYFYYKHGKDKPINVLFSYGSNFSHFNQWYVQLWGESLGKFDKKLKKVGLTPVGLIGSIDQHSFLQLIMQGPENKTLTFIKINDFESDIKVPDIKLEGINGVNYINTHTFSELINAQCMATLESVYEVGIPVDLITLNQLNEHSLARLIYYYELLTSILGVMFEINTYDQPGVEFGKKKLIKKFVKEA